MNTLSIHVTTRNKAVQVVATIADQTGEKSSRIWRRIYSRLQLLHNVDLASYSRMNGESLLNVAERYGYMDKVYEAVLTEWLFSQTTATQ